MLVFMVTSLETIGALTAPHVSEQPGSRPLAHMKSMKGGVPKRTA